MAGCKCRRETWKECSKSNAANNLFHFRVANIGDPFFVRYASACRGSSPTVKEGSTLAIHALPHGRATAPSVSGPHYAILRVLFPHFSPKDLYTSYESKTLASDHLFPFTGLEVHPRATNFPSEKVWADNRQHHAWSATCWLRSN